MADHTPLPWRVEQPNPDRPIFIIINKKYGIVVHKTTGGDAEFIVRACNSHGELLEVLEALKELMPWVSGVYTRKSPNALKAIERVKQAIAKAEEGRDVE